MVTLKNGGLTVQISPHGAEMQSVRPEGGREILWNGDPAYWKRHAPVLFPICGSLKDGRYRLDGKLYPMGRHGFARDLDFAVESQRPGSAVFRLDSSPETEAVYPFQWTLRVGYTLEGRSVRIDYTVGNRSDRTLYFSIGAHEAYACPEGIEAYEVVFPQKETLQSERMAGGLLSGRMVPVLQDGDTLPLKQAYFREDALVFHQVKSRSVRLRNRQTGRFLQVDFGGFEHLLLWAKPGAPFFCIEPWCGISDPVGSDQNFAAKPGIQRLPAGGAFRRSHTIHLENA